MNYNIDIGKRNIKDILQKTIYTTKIYKIQCRSIYRVNNNCNIKNKLNITLLPTIFILYYTYLSVSTTVSSRMPTFFKNGMSLASCIRLSAYQKVIYTT